MKYKYVLLLRRMSCVTLHVRAWIEMICVFVAPSPATVTLHVRAWIEILIILYIILILLVTLHVRAWIEISSSLAR